jgi:hypothetical protein
VTAYLDLGGGNRIPRISERKARTVDELRSAGVGVSHALLVHSGTADGSDLFKAVLTMLDAHVALSVVALPAKKGAEEADSSWLQQDMDRALQLRREIDIQTLPDGDSAQAIVKLAQSEKFDLVILGQPAKSSYGKACVDVDYVLEHSPCWVCLVTPTPIPQEVDDGKASR